MKDFDTERLHKTRNCSENYSPERLRQMKVGFYEAESDMTGFFLSTADTFKTLLDDLYSDQALIEDTIVMLSKKLISCAWVELLVVERNRLRVCGGKQSIRYLEINEESLPGWVAMYKESQAIPNASHNTFYNNFTYKLIPYNNFTKRVAKPISTLAVPILNTSGEVMAVFQLFNKIDTFNSQIYFTDRDIENVQSLGTLLVSLRGCRNAYFSMKKEKEDLEGCIQEHTHITKFMNLSYRRKKLLARLKEILLQNKLLDIPLLDLIKDIMNSDIAIVHLIDRDFVEPYLVSGADSVTDDINTSVAEYCGLTDKKLFNIRDINSEPLCKSNPWKMRSIISCPIFDSNKECTGVIEFYSKSNEFGKLDETYARKIAKYLGKLALKNENTQERHFLLSNLKNTSLSNSVVKSLYTFKLDVNSSFFDYVGFIKEIELSIKRSCNLDSFSLFFSDQHEQVLKTHKSEGCEILTFSRSPDTLLGYVYENKTILNYTGQKLPIKDMRFLTDRNLLCIPVVGKFTSDPVMAIIMLSRVECPFSQEETAIVMHYHNMIADILEHLFYGNFPREAVPDDQISKITQNPSFEFRMLNLKPLKPSDDSFRFLISPTKLKPEKKSLNFTNFSSKGNKFTNFLSPILDLYSLGEQQVDAIRDLIRSLRENSDTSLKIFNQKLQELIPCDSAKLYILDHSESHLIDTMTEGLIVASGLLKQAIETRKIVYIPFSASKHFNFNKISDKLCIEGEIDSFLALPILYTPQKTIGVLAFVKKSGSFIEKELKLAKFLTMIPREFLHQLEHSSLKWKEILEIGRKHKMLQLWCKQIFYVSNYAQHYTAMIKDILQMLNMHQDIETLLKASLQVICAVTYAEKAAIILKSQEIYEIFEGESFEELDEDKANIDIYNRIYASGALVHHTINIKDNLLFVPIKQKGKVIAIIRTINKRDETLTRYCNFTRQDEEILSQFAEAISEPLNCSLIGRPIPYNSISEVIKNASARINDQNLLKTIRNALENLINCDRAAVFIKEGDSMVVKHQGLDHELPQGYCVKIGTGIVGSVALTGKSEILQDAYADSRFNPELDRLSGYKTSNMLCIPVFNSDKNIIAVLRMTNKRNRMFDQSDEETLEAFCEVISTVLQNWQLFDRNIEDKTRLTDIVNRIGDYLIVLNSEGKLDYVNKPFDQIFGVPEKLAKSMHFVSWLRYNRVLSDDIESVYQNPHMKIFKKEEKIYISKLWKSQSISSFKKELRKTEEVYNYRILALNSKLSLQTPGVIIILEKCDLFSNPLPQLTNLDSSPIKTETTLQICIDELSTISNRLKSSELRENLDSVIEKLKEGDLKKTYLTLNNENKSTSFDVNEDVVRLQGMLNYQIKHFTREDNFLKESQFVDLTVLPTARLEILRDWNLNAFEISDYFMYIQGIFQDFDLFQRYKISSNILYSFSKHIEELYSTKQNPFHNFSHGFSVMHSIYMLLTSTPAGSVFSSSKVLALLIAGLCHDVDHTGRSNSFEISSQSHLSILYHDKSVLENHHAAVTFFVMQNKDQDVLLNLKPEKKRNVRKFIISAILGTDMAKHLNMMSDMKNRLGDINNSPLGCREKDHIKLAQLLTHIADLAHPCKTFDVYSQWSKKVCQEFTAQYSEERDRGLPPTEFMKDLDRPTTYYKNEIGFLVYVVKPLWDCANIWLKPSLDKCFENIYSNIQTMKQLLEKHEEEQK